MPDGMRPYASSPCMMHELGLDAAEQPRLLPDRRLPPYAYLPGGRFPHPVRDRDGHSFGEAASAPFDVSLSSGAFRWGTDLFNHGYYWEAHEAWEPLWRSASRGDPLRALLKGLILLAAAGVKDREGKAAACAKHAGRAAALFRTLAACVPQVDGLGMATIRLARHAEAIAETPPHASGSAPKAVFDFSLPASNGC